MGTTANMEPTFSPNKALGAARSISPLIRFSRYAALAAGFFYGSWNLRNLTKREEEVQEHENKIRSVREAKLKAEKDKYVQAEMEALGKETGVIKEEVEQDLTQFPTVVG